MTYEVYHAIAAPSDIRIDGNTFTISDGTIEFLDKMNLHHFLISEEVIDNDTYRVKKHFSVEFATVYGVPSMTFLLCNSGLEKVFNHIPETIYFKPL